MTTIPKLFTSACVALRGKDSDINIKGGYTTQLRFADDIVVMVNSLEVKKISVKSLTGRPYIDHDQLVM